MSDAAAPMSSAAPAADDLARLVDTVPTAILVVSRRRVAYANELACRILGAAAADELVGRNAAAFLDSRSWRAWVAARRSDTGAAAVRLLRLDGSGISVSVKARSTTWRGAPAVAVTINDSRSAQAINRDLSDRLVELENLTANVPGLIYQRRIDPDGRHSLTFVAGRALENHGISNERLRAHPELLLEAMHPDDRVKVRELARHATEAMEPLEYQFRLIDRDGNVKWAHTVAKPRRQADGAVIWDGVMRDITQLKEEAKTSDLLSRALLACPDGIIITEPTSTQSRVRFVNPAFERITGYSKAEMLMRDPEMLAADGTNLPQTQEIREAVANGESGSAVLRSKKKNGEYYWTDLHLAGIRDEEGRLTHFVGAIKDVTEGVEARERLQAAIETMPDGLVIYDRNGRLVLCNATFKDINRFSVSDLVEPGIAAEDLMRAGIERGHFGEVSDADRQFLVDRAIRLATVPGDNEIAASENRWLRIRTRRLPGGGTICVYTDITKIKEAEFFELELRRRQRMEALGTLAGGTAHEFNNMLVPIKTLAELSRDEIDGGNPAQEYLEKIVQSADRASNLVRKILAFTRSEESVERTPVALDQVLRDNIQLLRRTLPSTISIVLDVAVTPAVTRADPGQIEQVLTNLCGNAEHAMRGTVGELRVRLREVQIDIEASAHDLPSGRYYLIEICDAGHGMDAPTLQRIFDPFFTTKPVGEGTGLGLSVSQAIVQAHDGLITAESEVGVGSTFRVILPVFEVDQRAPEDPAWACGEGRAEPQGIGSVG